MSNSACGKNPHFGDVYLMRFDGSGSEQSGWSPGVVIQNNVGNAHSPNIIALPLTSSIKKTDQPTHVLIPSNGTGLKKDSMVLCENPERMSKEKLGSYITTLPVEYIQKIAVAYLLSSCVISYINPYDLLVLRQQAVVMNQNGR